MQSMREMWANLQYKCNNSEQTQQDLDIKQYEMQSMSEVYCVLPYSLLNTSQIMNMNIQTIIIHITKEN